MPSRRHSSRVEVLGTVFPGLPHERDDCSFLKLLQKLHLQDAQNPDL